MWSNNWTLSIGELAERVSEIMAVPFKILNSMDQTVGAIVFHLTNSKLHLGLVTTTRFASAVLEMVDKLQPHFHQYKNFREGNLMRLNVLREMTANGRLSKSLRLLENNNGG